MQLSKLGDMLSKLMPLKRVTDMGLGAEPPAAGGFRGLQFFEIKTVLMSLDHISLVFRAICKN